MDNNRATIFLKIISIFLLLQFICMNIFGFSINNIYEYIGYNGINFLIANYLILFLILLSAAIGMFFNKKWSVFAYWAYVIIPVIFAKFIMHDPLDFLYLIFYIFNIIGALVNTLIFWGKISKENLKMFFLPHRKNKLIISTLITLFFPNFICSISGVCNSLYTLIFYSRSQWGRFDLLDYIIFILTGALYFGITYLAISLIIFLSEKTKNKKITSIIIMAFLMILILYSLLIIYYHYKAEKML